MQEGLPWGESPVDHEGDTKPGLGWATSVMTIGSLMLIFTNSHAISNWANQQEITRATAPLITAAENWHARTGRLGLNWVVDTVKGQAKVIRRSRWQSSETNDASQK